MTFGISIYGTLISLSILVCIVLAEKRVKAVSHNSALVWDLAVNAIISGLIGARAYHVVDLWSYYKTNPLLILHFWNGGLGIWGAIFGIIVGTWVYIKLQYKNEKPLFWFDVMASAAPLGQAIGRWGNFFNRENFGFPTDLPWGVYIDDVKRPPEYTGYSRFHPLFLYESILNFILFICLTYMVRKTGYGSGRIFAYYIFGYALIRFFLEFLRINPWTINGINVAQGVSVVGILAVLTFIKFRRL